VLNVLTVVRQWAIGLLTRTISCPSSAAHSEHWRRNHGREAVAEMDHDFGLGLRASGFGLGHGLRMAPHLLRREA
jgi:hypothetical protein